MQLPGPSDTVITVFCHYTDCVCWICDNKGGGEECFIFSLSSTPLTDYWNNKTIWNNQTNQFPSCAGMKRVQIPWYLLTYLGREVTFHVLTLGELATKSYNCSLANFRAKNEKCLQNTDFSLENSANKATTVWNDFFLWMSIHLLTQNS